MTAVVQIMASALAQADLPEPVGLVLDDAPVQQATGSSLAVVVFAIFAMAAIVSLAMAWWALADGSGLEPEELAFRRLCRRLRVRRSVQPVLRELAEAHGRAAPVALLVSPSACGEALDRYREHGGPHQEQAEQLAESLHGLSG